MGWASVVAGGTRTAPSGSKPSGDGCLSTAELPGAFQAKGILLPSHHKLQIKDTY